MEFCTPTGSSRPRRSGGGSSLSPGGSLALLVSSRSICRRAGPGPSTSPPPSPGCGRSRSRPDAARPRRPLHCLAPACLRAPPHRRLLLSARPDSNRRTLPAPPTAPVPPKTTVSRSTARATQTVGGFGLSERSRPRARAAILAAALTGVSSRSPAHHIRHRRASTPHRPFSQGVLGVIPGAVPRRRAVRLRGGPPRLRPIVPAVAWVSW